ncbi:MAG TPA: GAF and ANTAR domain-containing protein [Pseudolysinimonas sp.]|jgi:hypothetical protein|nr:GAF and ANTAR domain-containing protein [Pseudolysinimonas sp.]
MNDRYTSALEVLRAAGDRPAAFAQPFVDVLPVSGAAVSTVGPVLGTETLAATDDLAARLDELQFDLTEGPCWDAINGRRPVLEPEMAERPPRDWPTFAAAASDYGVSSIFAFPLLVGALPIGAVDLYSIPPITLTNDQCRQAIAMSDIIGRHVLRHAIETGSIPDAEPEPGAFSRRVIHQATGVVIAQLRLAPDDALVIIQGHAFATGRPMKEVARDIVHGDLAFKNGDTGIEVA